MRCPYCGRENAPNARGCAYCRRAFAPQQQRPMPQGGMRRPTGRPAPKKRTPKFIRILRYLFTPDNPKKTDIFLTVGIIF